MGENKETEKQTEDEGEKRARIAPCLTVTSGGRRTSDSNASIEQQMEGEKTKGRREKSQAWQTEIHSECTRA